MAGLHSACTRSPDPNDQRECGSRNRGEVRRERPADLLRERVFGRATAVLTSATLTLGGNFDAMAAAWGLNNSETEEMHWRGVDVGSPFRHDKSAILYVARHLPPPGRDGSGSPEQLAEIADLVAAAGGRTLGLFSSMRAATAAAAEMRERLAACEWTADALEKLLADYCEAKSLVNQIRRRPSASHSRRLYDT